MPRRAQVLKSWAPVFAWMAVIFFASTDVGSGQHSSHFLGPFLRWLVPGISEPAVEGTIYAIRKSGHMAEYAVLAWLLWRAGRKSVKGDTRPWNWRLAGLALAGAVAYAATDELHQAFEPSRFGCLADVFYDTAGAAVGLVAIWCVERWRRRR